MRAFAPTAAAALFAALQASPLSADPKCTCRAPGRHFELGQTTCLMTPKGGRLATCGLVINNTSWQFSDTPCTVSAFAWPLASRVAEAGPRF
jgi:hypothetical protein